MTEHLGHVVGRLLDGGPRFGAGTVRIKDGEGQPADWAVEFVKPDRWRADDGTERWVCDGTLQAFTSANGIREEVPARSDWAPMMLYPFFPLTARVWGRWSDDWRLCPEPVQREGRTVVQLESTRASGRYGQLVLDDEDGFIAELRLSAYTVTVTSFASEPPDPARLRT